MSPPQGFVIGSVSQPDIWNRKQTFKLSFCSHYLTQLDHDVRKMPHPYLLQNLLDLTQMHLVKSIPIIGDVAATLFCLLACPAGCSRRRSSCGEVEVKNWKLGRLVDLRGLRSLPLEPRILKGESLCCRGNQQR